MEPKRQHDKDERQSNLSPFKIKAIPMEDNSWDEKEIESDGEQQDVSNGKSRHKNQLILSSMKKRKD